MSLAFPYDNVVAGVLVLAVGICLASCHEAPEQ